MSKGEEMTRRQVVCALFVLVLAVLCGSVATLAAELAPPAPQPQAAVAAPLPSFLTTPASKACAATSENALAGVTAGECGEGCSFQPLDYCEHQCCGGPGACIDTWDGGYCVC
jgi:hypothetical protein